LSALEGLKVDAPQLGPVVLPLAVVILLGLFFVQRRGTGFIGGIFGPVMLAWFVTIGILGGRGIALAPSILAALNPAYAVTFLLHSPPVVAFAVLGGTFLAVTGGEAMCADLGHFGRTPIRAAWFAIVLPALLLNYFGQGGLLLTEPRALENPFYQLAPDWFHYPLVVFATLATIIASQAIISGAYSARVPSTAHRAPHCERGEGPNLCACRKLDSGRRDARRGGWLRFVRQPCRRLWDSCFAPHGDNHVSGSVGSYPMGF
jgi:KUP system potassium uptake protein